MSSQAEYVGAGRLVAVRRVRSQTEGPLRLSGSGSADTSRDLIIAGSLSLPYTKPPWTKRSVPLESPSSTP